VPNEDEFDTSQLGYKAYKCHICSWVHAALPLAVVVQQGEYAGYYKCFRCRAPSSEFVPAQAGDAPKGSTIQGVYVPGAWED